MFLDLINLYNKYQKGSITPLEDFNTEIFANLLVMYPNILDSFLLQFFDLEKQERLKVKTQQRERITGKRSDCIVDLVISCEKYVMFIENKVESHEGDEQLDRYTQALHENHPDKTKLLAYCTKYADPKEHQDKQVDFYQFRWYEIASFLETFSPEPVVKSYLEFLSHYKMNQDNTLKTEHLIAYENMSKAIEIAEFHIENVKPEFQLKFDKENINKNVNWEQLKFNQRLCYYKHGILGSTGNSDSHILYGIYLNKLTLNAQIWLRNSNDALKKLELVNHTDLIKTINENGDCLLTIETDLGIYLNRADADKEIKKWFLASFNRLETLIQDIKTLKP